MGTTKGDEVNHTRRTSKNTIMKDLVCINKKKIFKPFHMKGKAVLLLCKMQFLTIINNLTWKHFSR